MEENQRKMMPPHAGEGVSGPELMELIRQQAKNFGTRVVTDDIVDVDLDAQPFKLTASSGEVAETHALIIATGVAHKRVPLQ